MANFTVKATESAFGFRMPVGTRSTSVLCQMRLPASLMSQAQKSRDALNLDQRNMCCYDQCHRKKYELCI